MSFDIIAETLERTTLGTLDVGDSVNLERSLQLGQELGGHLLSGHISSTATIRQIDSVGGRHDLLLQLSAEGIEYVLEKGFIAIDGISLTIGTVDVEQNSFWLHIIPETISRTTIGERRVGSQVNVEFDAQTVAIVETVRRMQED